MLEIEKLPEILRFTRSTALNWSYCKLGCAVAFSLFVIILQWCSDRQSFWITAAIAILHSRLETRGASHFVSSMMTSHGLSNYMAGIGFIRISASWSSALTDLFIDSHLFNMLYKMSVFLFICLVLGLILETVGMILAPVLSSNTWDLTLVTSSRIPTPLSLSSSTKFMIGTALDLHFALWNLLLCCSLLFYLKHQWPCQRAYRKITMYPVFDFVVALSTIAISGSWLPQNLCRTTNPLMFCLVVESCPYSLSLSNICQSLALHAFELTLRLLQTLHIEHCISNIVSSWFLQ